MDVLGRLKRPETPLKRPKRSGLVLDDEKWIRDSGAGDGGDVWDV
jgi:hypothetical protein